MIKAASVDQLCSSVEVKDNTGKMQILVIRLEGSTPLILLMSLKEIINIFILFNIKVYIRPCIYMSI